MRILLRASAVLAIALLAPASGADPLPGAPPFPPALGARLQPATLPGPGSDPPRTRHLDPEGRPRFTNRLVLETSPYLRQHAHNPVNWYPWGDEAFAAARKAKRPIFLSIGYSTCHWCHVMEEESFENLAIAELLNRHFVAIKVDREERPDVDAIYMAAVQHITGRGGWPLTVFLTPDRQPFFGGTYFPPRDGDRGRSTGLLTLLQRIHERFTQDPAGLAHAADSFTESLRAALAPANAVGIPTPRAIERAVSLYARRFDPDHGGLRSRTKFPALLPIPLLLRVHRRTGDPEALRMARTTLDAMMRGGLYDHVGGGFHRYTVEPTWTVPHFEKMLYDNALLVRSYLEAFQVTGDARYADVVRDVLDYLTREMRSLEGTFYAATDADSEGEEGRYYVWTPDEIREAVGEKLARLALDAYGVTEEGNFDGGRSVLRRDRSVRELAKAHGISPQEVRSRLATIRERLRAARSARIPPHTDRKQIVAWNGLAISAFARAAFVLGEPSYGEVATRAAAAILERARPDGRLARYLLAGQPRGTGLLDDHAFLVAALLDLVETRPERRWIDAALALQRDLDRRFFDETRGGYFRTPEDGEALLVREKPARDGAVPSGNSVAVLNLLRILLLTGDDDARARAEMTLRAFSDRIEADPTEMSRMLEAVDFLSDRAREILVVAPESLGQALPFLRILAETYDPNHVALGLVEPALADLSPAVPILQHKRALGGRVTAYVCENGVCDLPARDAEVFRKQLSEPPPPYADPAPTKEETGGGG